MQGLFAELVKLALVVEKGPAGNGTAGVLDGADEDDVVGGEDFAFDPATEMSDAVLNNGRALR